MGTTQTIEPISKATMLGWSFIYLSTIRKWCYSPLDVAKAVKEAQSRGLRVIGEPYSDEKDAFERLGISAG